MGAETGRSLELTQQLASPLAKFQAHGKLGPKENKAEDDGGTTAEVVPWALYHGKEFNLYESCEDT